MGMCVCQHLNAVRVGATIYTHSQSTFVNTIEMKIMDSALFCIMYPTASCSQDVMSFHPSSKIAHVLP